MAIGWSWPRARPRRESSWSRPQRTDQGMLPRQSTSSCRVRKLPGDAYQSAARGASHTNVVSRQVDRHGRLPKSTRRILAALTLALAANPWNGRAWAQEEAARTIPSRILPVPDTVSPALQKLIGQPLSPPQEIPRTARSEEHTSELQSPMYLG